MRDISYYDLGATLYLPVLNKNLGEILKREKYPFLKSIVICLEDSLAEKDVEKGLQRLADLLKQYKRTSLKVFIRPRHISNLKLILKIKNIKLIDGFSIPKFDTLNISEYLSIFINENSYHLMPILETKDVFSSVKLHSILTELEPFKERVLTIRVGGEDIMSLLGNMREETKTIYEIMPLYIVLSTVINIFKPNGYNISSPVYSNFENQEVLLREVKGDIEHQIFNKTSIHPKQIELIQDNYKVLDYEYKIAHKLIHGKEEVFSVDARMYEKKTHFNWANSIMNRFNYFGVFK